MARRVSSLLVRQAAKSRAGWEEEWGERGTGGGRATEFGGGPGRAGRAGRVLRYFVL